ncbi:MAG TPA: helix-turn-helix domain-containing protein [Acidimicrobiales bacterium]|nr:helix-turn-helix domain-containing protein [Acidimicrobiales bacterium]
MTPKESPPQLNVVAAHHQPKGIERLVLSIAEAAEALGVSDDLVYELTERGDLPCLRLGRRKVIPRRAIQLVVDAALVDFDPAIALTIVDRAKREWADPATLAEASAAPR